jgi:TRAP-type mannitol/chloroaromatic compound transport system permease small subunit
MENAHRNGRRRDTGTLRRRRHQHRTYIIPRGVDGCSSRIGAESQRVPGQEQSVQALLAFSRAVDRLNEAIGKGVLWLILAVVVISAGNAIWRYAFDWSSNGLLEVQWYLFSAIFMLMSGYVLKRNEHIRIDIISGRLSPRAQNWIDVFGLLVFLLPMAVLVLWLSWPVFMNAWNSGETSPSYGGLIRWPVRLLMPVGFLLLTLQALAELVKRLAFLAGSGPDPLQKGSGPGVVEEVAQAIRKGHGLDAPEAAAGNADRGDGGAKR